MRFRMWFFSVLALLAAGWVCYGLSATASSASSVSATPATTSQYLSQKDANAARGVGVAIGSGLSVTFFACTGLPLFAIFSLLAWRNQVGLRTERRHREQLEAQERQLHALQQTAMAQTAQAAMQFATMQPPPTALPDPGGDVSAKFATAKELIDAHEYDAARAILRRMNHPQATDWLQKLDRIDPKQA